MICAESWTFCVPFRSLFYIISKTRWMFNSFDRLPLSRSQKWFSLFSATHLSSYWRIWYLIRYPCVLVTFQFDSVSISWVEITNWSRLSIHSFVFKNETEQNRNDEKYSQTGITVKIHTHHDGVRTTAIMLRSNADSSSWRSPVIAVK